MTIRRLSVQLANQIAAGEVVERPASVVKELLENAVDAGGKKITLEIKGAGRQLIRVRDDGVGIPKDELALALAPHATSKISTFEDLNAITTLGFRGEALASIASVSKLTLTSKVRESENAYSVYVEGPEQISKIFPAAHLDGTTVEVSELFFNTPARRRFLKSDRSEMIKIRDVFTRCALANPHLGFELISEGKSLCKVNAAADESSRMRRLSKLLCPEFEREGIVIHGEHPALEIEGILLSAPPAFAQVQELVYIFLNGRAVADRMLSHALKEGFFESYRRNVPVRAVVYLRCDPHEVDVNVHPRKDEVRFHNTAQVHDIVVQTIINSLSRCLDKASPEESMDLKEINPPENLPAFPSGVSSKNLSPNNTYDSTLALKPIKKILTASPVQEHFFKNAQESVNKENQDAYVSIEHVHTLSDIDISAVREKSIFTILDEPVCGASLVRFDNRLFFVRTDSLLTKVRILEYTQDVLNDSVKASPMLVPFAVKLGPLQLKALKDAKENACRCGFNIDFSRTAVSLQSIPEIIRGCDLANLAPNALTIIAAAKDNLSKGICPVQLADLIAKASSPIVLTQNKIQELLDKFNSLDDLLSLGDDCQEVPIKRLAKEFLGRA